MGAVAFQYSHRHRQEIVLHKIPLIISFPQKFWYSNNIPGYALENMGHKFNCSTKTNLTKLSYTYINDWYQSCGIGMHFIFEYEYCGTKTAELVPMHPYLKNVLITVCFAKCRLKAGYRLPLCKHEHSHTRCKFIGAGMQYVCFFVFCPGASARATQWWSKRGPIAEQRRASNGRHWPSGA